VALFGCWSSASRKQVAPLCDAHDRLLFYPAVYEGLESHPRVVYLGGTPNQTISHLLKFTDGTLRRDRIFLVGSEQLYSRAIEPLVEHQVKGEAEVVGRRYLPLGTRDFTDVVKEIAASKADVILNTIDGSGNVPFCKALRAAGLRPPAVVTVWVNVSECELAQYDVKDLEGDYSVANYFESLDDPANAAFVARYRKRYGEKERVSDGMQTAYFGVHLWKQAVEKAGTTDTEAVAKALPNMTINAPEGRLRVDPNRLHADRYARVGKVVFRKSTADFDVVAGSPKLLAPDPYPDWRGKAEWDKDLDTLYRGWGNRWEKHAPPAPEGGK
jgi:urea transport system substrate-binding protein